jgi:hypothetical protein
MIKTNLIDTRAAEECRRRIDRERNKEGGAGRIHKATAPGPSSARPYWEKGLRQVGAKGPLAA